jgi:SAM-dependent methyltransferase
LGAENLQENHALGRALTLMTWEEAILWLRGQKELQALLHDGYYGEPLLGEWDRFHRSKEWGAVQRIIGTDPQPRAKALDLGAGRGIVSYALAQDQWNVFSLEPDPSEVVGAQAIRSQENQSIKVCRALGERLPFPADTFDVVICRAVLHHSRDLGKLCAEIRRVLKRGGKFLAMREHVISRARDLPLFLSRHPLHHLYGGENAFTLPQYRQAFSRAGLRLCREFGPCCSDINLHPLTREKFIEKRKQKLGRWLPDGWAQKINEIRGKTSHEPGRLYTFFLTTQDK